MQPKKVFFLILIGTFFLLHVHTNAHATPIYKCNSPEMKLGRAITVVKESRPETNTTHSIYYSYCRNGEVKTRLEGIYGINPPFSTIQYEAGELLHEDIWLQDKQKIVYVYKSDWILKYKNQNCKGKEWSLGRVIEVGPRGVDDSGYRIWKAKLGVCDNTTPKFVSSLHWQQWYEDPDIFLHINMEFGEPEPGYDEAHGELIHTEPWFVDEEKNRTYYVFESDWQKWHKQRQLAAITAINSLLLKKLSSQHGPGELAYTPDNPSPTAKNESILTLTDTAWQRVYKVGEMYAQIEVRADGAKIKFGQRININHVKFFDIRYKIPVSADWHPGTAPFILSDMFPGYIFKDEFYPEDEKDIWTARMFIPGYKHAAWTPTNPNPKAATEGIITLSENSWQNMYPIGTTYCQISLNDANNAFKIKFGLIQDGYVEIFNLYRDIPIFIHWARGDEPMELLFEYPEYKFGPGIDPGGPNDVWTARVWIPGYNF